MLRYKFIKLRTYSLSSGFAEIHQIFGMSHNNHHRRTATHAAESVAKRLTSKLESQ